MGERQVTEWEKLPGASTCLVSCLGLLCAVMEVQLTELIWRWWVICPRSCVTLQAFEPRQLSIRMQVSNHCTIVPSGTWIPIYSLESRFFAMIAFKQRAWHISCFGVCSCATHILWGNLASGTFPDVGSDHAVGCLILPSLPSERPWKCCHRLLFRGVIANQIHNKISDRIRLPFIMNCYQRGGGERLIRLMGNKCHCASSHFTAHRFKFR